MELTLNEITEICTQISSLLPQFSGFIDQFHKFIMDNDINVISDGVNNSLKLDVPGSMPQGKMDEAEHRVYVLDRLIKAREKNIESLIQKGLSLETKVSTLDSSYKSQILDKANEFRKLRESYKH